MPDSIERIFLGWGAPALPAAAELLVERYRTGDEARLDGALIALPGARAGRRLKELLIESATARSLRLVPPRVVVVGALPEQFYEPDAPLADPFLACRLWSIALRTLAPDRLALLFPHAPERGDVRGWQVLAREVARLHGEVGGAGLLFRDVVERCDQGLLYDDGERWQVLAEAQAGYVDALGRLGRVDRELARIAALQHGHLACDADVWLVGIAELPVVTRRMLRAVAAALAAPVRALVHAPASRATDFDSEGCVLADAWLSAELPIPDEAVSVCDRPTDQAEAALAEVASLASSRAVDEVAVGVPDETVVAYLEQRFSASGLPVRYAAGLPLRRTGPYRLLVACADYLAGRRYEAAAALARHPDVGRWLAAQRGPAAGARGARASEPLETLDRYFSRHLPSRLGGRLPGNGRTQARTERLRRALERLVASLDGRRRLSEWAEPVLELLVRVYGSLPLHRENPRDRGLVEVCTRIHAAVTALDRLPEAVDEECDAGTAIRLILDEVGADTIPPEPDRAAIELLGWLELHLDDAAAVVVAGFNEPFLPESVNADVFLPNALRTRLGLTDNERRYARDAYYLTAILRSAERVRLIAGRTAATGEGLRPSRLWFAASGRTLAERVQRFYAPPAQPAAPLPAAGPSASGASRFRVPPEPEIRLPTPLTTLRITDFAAILRDPYVFALERVLGLESLDDEARELPGRDFGGLAHVVLQRFAATDAAAAADEQTIRRALDRLLDELAAERYGTTAFPAVRVQIEQLRARLHAFAGWQATWVGEGWRTVRAEAEPPGGSTDFVVDGEPIRLRGRVDRIDHHAAREEWVVFDYKTGETARTPDETHRRGRGRDRPWVDLQLPLYRHLVAALQDDDGAPLVPRDTLPDLRLGYILLPGDRARTRHELTDWDETELAAADEAARDVVRLVRRGVFHFDPNRPGRFVRGPLAALLGRGQLAGGE